MSSMTAVRETRWAVPLLPLVIAAYALGALALSPETFPAMAQGYFRQMILLVAILLVSLPVAAVLLRPRSPVAGLSDLLRQGGVRLLATVLCFCLGMAAFTTFKLAIPDVVPFYADMALADLDAWLHGGDPGLWLHAVLPDWVASGIAVAYVSVWFSLWFGLLAFVALQSNAELRRQYFWSMALAMVLLGTIVAAAMSSVGPIFYDQFIAGDRFAALVAAIGSSGAGEMTLKTAGYLYTTYQTDGIQLGSGISAMPSMHLAVTTLHALLLSRLHRALGVLGGAYLLIIMIGSVYLGWHYAVDGYVSIASVCLIWWGVSRFAPDRRAKPVLAASLR